jgi:hypothetical protein
MPPLLGAKEQATAQHSKPSNTMSTSQHRVVLNNSWEEQQLQHHQQHLIQGPTPTARSGKRKTRPIFLQQALTNSKFQAAACCSFTVLRKPRTKLTATAVGMKGRMTLPKLPTVQSIQPSHFGQRNALLQCGEVIVPASGNSF